MKVFKFFLFGITSLLTLDGFSHVNGAVKFGLPAAPLDAIFKNASLPFNAVEKTPLEP